MNIKRMLGIGCIVLALIIMAYGGAGWQTDYTFLGLGSIAAIILSVIAFVLFSTDRRIINVKRQMD